MDNQTIEILKLITSVLTPLVILILGILINKTLEKNKSTLSLERDWQNWWAEKLLSTAENFNLTVSNIITEISYLEKYVKDKKSAQKYTENANTEIRKLQSISWNFENYAQSAENKGVELNRKLEKITFLIYEALSKNKLKIGEIKKAQLEFNKLVRQVHAEILNLNQ